MPGPLPKPDEERRRRNAPTIPTTDVPLAGYIGDVPEPTVTLGAAARLFYDRAWRSSAAAAWLADEADAVAEWAGLKAIVAAQLAAGEAPQSALLAQIKAREDALYLSPLARAKGRVRVVDLELADVDVSDAGLGRFGAADILD